MILVVLVLNLTIMSKKVFLLNVWPTLIRLLLASDSYPLPKNVSFNLKFEHVV